MGGEWFAFDMCRTVVVDGLNLLTAPAGSMDITDVPASYNILVSTDGVNWTQVFSSSTPPVPQADTADGAPIMFSPAVAVRYMMIMQTGLSAGAYWWSIHEISPVCGGSLDAGSDAASDSASDAANDAASEASDATGQ